MNEFSEIQNYIPQRSPFEMVDTLLEVSETTTKTSFKIPAENILCDEGIFSEAGLLENIAQTAAAGNGFRQIRQSENPKIGFIGAIKKLTIHKHPIAGNELITTVTKVSDYANALIVDGKIELKGIIIVSCQMNIFIIDEPNPLQA